MTSDEQNEQDMKRALEILKERNPDHPGNFDLFADVQPVLIEVRMLREAEGLSHG